jgi:hypothetical protein
VIRCAHMQLAERSAWTCRQAVGGGLGTLRLGSMAAPQVDGADAAAQRPKQPPRCGQLEVLHSRGRCPSGASYNLQADAWRVDTNWMLTPTSCASVPPFHVLQ